MHGSKNGECLKEILALLAIILFSMVPIASSESECDGYLDLVNYVEIEPIDHSITTGKFERLCGDAYHMWYDIDLQVDEPGSLTITIPKNKLDLRQFDYPSCNTHSFTDESPYSQNITSVQISQTADSRTIKFSWNKPVPKISYFWIFSHI